MRVCMFALPMHSRRDARAREDSLSKAAELRLRARGGGAGTPLSNRSSRIAFADSAYSEVLFAEERRLKVISSKTVEPVIRKHEEEEEEEKGERFNRGLILDERSKMFFSPGKRNCTERRSMIHFNST